MDSNERSTAVRTQMDMDAGDLHLRRSNALHSAADVQDRESAKNDAPCGNLNISSMRVGLTPLTSPLKAEDESCIVMSTAGSNLERKDCLTTSGDGTGVAGGCHQQPCDAFILETGPATSGVEVASSDLPPVRTEFMELIDIVADTRDVSLDDALWDNTLSNRNTDREKSTGSIERISSTSSTISARSLDPDAADASWVSCDSLMLGIEMDEPEMGAKEISLWSCDSTSSDIDYMDSIHFESDADISLVPMESLQLSMESANSLMLCAAGAGSTSLPALNLHVAGADWHLGCVPVKCLELGAVNFASLTLGTVGISVTPMVSASTTATNATTKSIDSLPQVASAADCVNVDSITPEGVRERWHPLEDRLYVLGEALTALDRRLEVFAPHLQEVETLVDDVEGSFTQRALRICDIMHEKSALTQRILLLEEQVKEEQQRHSLDGK